VDIRALLERKVIQFDQQRAAILVAMEGTVRVVGDKEGGGSSGGVTRGAKCTQCEKGTNNGERLARYV